MRRINLLEAAVEELIKWPTSKKPDMAVALIADAHAGTADVEKAKRRLRPQR